MQARILYKEETAPTGGCVCIISGRICIKFGTIGTERTLLKRCVHQVRLDCISRQSHTGTKEATPFPLNSEWVEKSPLKSYRPLVRFPLVPLSLHSG